jgi:acyl-coenzyme A synthetase/AMP-(fatty) acid ligase
MLSALLHPDSSHRWVDRDGETQADLVAHAHRIAALLDGRGGRVVLSCRQARSYVPGLLGAWLAGATVELLPNVQPGTLDRVDADDDVAAVLHDSGAWRDRSPKAIYLPDVLAHVPEPGDQTTSRATRGPGLQGAEIAVRMTTSGTTERPRYVTKTMAQLVEEIDVHAAVVPAARAVLSTVPLSHLYGLLWGVLLPLRIGARIVSHEALLPADVAAVIERESVDLMISTPAHLRAMLSAAMPRGLRVVTSGARLPAELHMGLAASHRWQVTDVLGSTETGGIATRQHPISAWIPLPRVTVSAPDGQLVVESPWCGGSRVELDERIELLPGGAFQYLGRNTELVKIAGKRALAHAIEATVLAMPGVTDAALMVHAALGKEPRVALAVSVAPNRPPGEPAVGRDTISAAIRAQFDAVFVPRVIKLVPRIPRTERGKVDSEALRELLGISAGALTSQIAIRRVAPGQYLADVPHNLVFFQGHFDAFAILPGAALVERVVWPVLKAEFPEILALRGIRRLRFRKPVFPDQQLSITLHRSPGRLTFEVSCAATAVASGQLLVD